MSTSRITREARVSLAARLMAEMTARETPHYFFFGDSITNTSPASVSGSLADELETSWNTMIAGKKIDSSDVCLVIRNSPWTSRKFDAHDDAVDVSDLDHYCVTNGGSYSHVFKCLENNSGANSTVEPDYSEISGANAVSYRTSDGYRWKYAYSVPASLVSTLASEDWFPLVANSTVEASAVPGSIQVVRVDEGGKLYNNYTRGTLGAADVRVGSNTVLYAVSNSQSSTTNGYYTGTIMTLTSGAGANQSKRVSSHVSNSSGNYLVLESAFSTAPSNGDEFEVYPEVVIVGDGYQTTNAFARAIVSANTSNSISRVEVIDPGELYTTATATVTAANVVGVSRVAEVVPVLPPKGGHCSNAAAELDARHVMVHTKISNTEFGTIPAANKYSRIGILKDPLFAGANLTIEQVTGNFSVGETLADAVIVPLDATAGVNTGSTLVTGSNSSVFTYQFSSGDEVVILDPLTGAGSVTSINTVSNNISMTLSSNSSFTGNSVIYSFETRHETTLRAVHSSSVIEISNVSGDLRSGTLLVGKTSGSTGIVNSCSRSGVSKFTDTFVQAHKVITGAITGTLLENENVLYSGGKATVHSVSGTTILLTAPTAMISPGLNIVGESSGATATISSVYSPELIENSGSVIYVENITPVTRSANTSETINTVISL